MSATHRHRACLHWRDGDDAAVPSPCNRVQSTRLSFAGVNNGPVKIESDQNIVAAERVIYKVNGIQTSFSEMMALAEQPAEHHLLAALVQQCGPGYPVEIWRAVKARYCTKAPRSLPPARFLAGGFSFIPERSLAFPVVLPTIECMKCIPCQQGKALSPTLGRVFPRHAFRS